MERCNKILKVIENASFPDDMPHQVVADKINDALPGLDPSVNELEAYKRVLQLKLRHQLASFKEEENNDS
jgi:hypothetical protein